MLLKPADDVLSLLEEGIMVRTFLKVPSEVSDLFSIKYYKKLENNIFFCEIKVFPIALDLLQPKTK